MGGGGGELWKGKLGVICFPLFLFLLARTVFRAEKEVSWGFSVSYCRFDFSFLIFSLSLFCLQFAISDPFRKASSPCFQSKRDGQRFRVFERLKLRSAYRIDGTFPNNYDHS